MPPRSLLHLSLPRACFSLPLVLLMFALLYFGATPALLAQETLVQIEPPSPPASERFGADVLMLPNGNFVVTDPAWNHGVGAVWLYDGETLEIISTLTGSLPGDRAGGGNHAVLTNGNFVVSSPGWQAVHEQGSPNGYGAATWGHAETGFIGVPVGGSGVVSAANSLVGAQSGDLVGLDVDALANGNYVVNSPEWSNGTIKTVGAVTWGNGATGTVGVVSGLNSMIGAQADDNIGDIDVYPLTNGNYVVVSLGWDNGPIRDAGAVTWGNGATGSTGFVTAARSLVGSRTGEMVGYGGVAPLTNGNYVVLTPRWSSATVREVGAVTWGNGATGTVGVVSAANSLVGATDQDMVGSSGVIPLTNGNYVVRSSGWDNDAAVDAGAVTWGNGASGTVGVVSAANSLAGSSANDGVGGHSVLALTNGNYVVLSPSWSNGAAEDAGAATWGNGAGGTVGIVSPANSLVGTRYRDTVGLDGVALTNGHYVVGSPNWMNGDYDHAGAATWGNGVGGAVGTITSANSLVGTGNGDSVGRSIVALANGNYVVGSSGWSKEMVWQMGAATWGNGAGGTVGPVTATNSLVGTTNGDEVGIVIQALANGNYAVLSPHWNNDALENVGAVTWGDGISGTVGAVSVANSFVGTEANELVGRSVRPLENGDLLVDSLNWRNGAIVNAGALTWLNGAAPFSGTVTAQNSVLGRGATSGGSMLTAYNPVYGYLVVGIRTENRLTIAATQGYTLTTQVQGEGMGMIWNRSLGTLCRTTCAIPIPANLTMTLETWRGPYTAFDAWGGACGGAIGGLCTVPMDADRTTSATFTASAEPGSATSLLPFVSDR